LTDKWALEREAVWKTRAVKNGWANKVPPLLDVVRLIRDRIGPCSRRRRASLRDQQIVNPGAGQSLIGDGIGV
jgi:hypothetical protein